MFQWAPLPSQLECKHGHIYLIGMSYDTDLDTIEYQHILSADEKEKASKFKFQIHRDRYVFFHACLRDILARYLNCSPNMLVFHKDLHGKPYLDKNHIQFNLSHSENEAILGITNAVEIGVDIEKINLEKNYDDIARRFFSRSEYAYLEQLSGKEKMDTFFQLWTHKEAFVKATGRGLSQQLKSFSIGLAPSKLITASQYDSTEWTIQPFLWKPGFMSAFATRQTMPEVIYYTHSMLNSRPIK